jgi:hypothetical protein
VLENCKSLNNFILATFNLKKIKLRNTFLDFYLEVINTPELFDLILSNRYLSKKLPVLIINKVKTYPVKSEKEDYYQFNKYTKNSTTLTKHSLELRKNTINFSKS